MPSVANKPLILSVNMLSVIMLSVMAPEKKVYFIFLLDSLQLIIPISEWGGWGVEGEV